MDVNTQIDGFVVTEALSPCWPDTHKGRYWAARDKCYLHSTGEVQISAEWFDTLDEVKTAIAMWKEKHE